VTGQKQSVSVDSWLAGSARIYVCPETISLAAEISTNVTPSTKYIVCKTATNLRYCGFEQFAGFTK